MKRKPIRIDWDDLESAFDNKREDLVYYLDLVTGQVVLEGEGEDDFEDDEDIPEEMVERGTSARNVSTRLYVEPPGPEDEVRWMEDFVAGGDESNGELFSSLEEALSGPEAIDGFRDLLRDEADVRDRWFLFRSKRVQESIDAWLDAHDVQIAEAPPWR